MILNLGMRTWTCMKKGIPCQGGVPPLQNEIEPYMKQIHHNWKFNADHHIEEFFNDFKSALEFVNKAGEICEQEDTMQTLELEGAEKIMIWT